MVRSERQLVLPVIRISDDEAIQLRKSSWFFVMSKSEMQTLTSAKNPFVIDALGRVFRIASVRSNRLSLLNLGIPRRLLWCTSVALEEKRGFDITLLASDITNRARRCRWKTPLGVRREQHLEDIEAVRTVADLFKEISCFGLADME